MSSPLSSLASQEPPRAPGWLAFLAGGVPLAFYLATASAHGGFYEEGAFIAAARSLGVPHPPGAALSTLVSALFALLPVGPLSFRVSVSAAVCAAGALGMFARALYFSLRGAGVREPGRAAWLALAAAWFVGQAPLFWQQAVRPNVFALQFLLSLIVIEALVRFEVQEPYYEDTRTLYFAAFVQGLCFANHHVFALLMLAPAAPTLGRVFARRGFIGLMGHVAFPILGFSAYAYVPIRASQQPVINFGEASTLPNLYWMLNEDPWWGPTELSQRSALAELVAGVGGAAPFALLVSAALGAGWYSVRVPSLRRFSVLWAIVLLVPLASVALLIRPRLLLDAWGALIPCLLGLVALAASGLGLSLEKVAARAGPGRDPVRLPARLIAATTLLGFLVAHGRGQAALTAPDAVDELTRRSLPADSLFLTHDAGSVFRHLGAEAEEQLRADVTLVPLGFLEFPGVADRLVERHPELRDLLREQLLGRELPASALRALGSERPLLLELTEAVSPDLYGSLTPYGLLARVLPDAAGETSAPANVSALLSGLSGERDPSPEDLLASRLARVSFYQALLAASRGELVSAQALLALGLPRAPGDVRLVRLAAMLPKHGRLAPNVVLRAVP